MDVLQSGLIFRDSYRLEKLIGRGGLGEVWLATDVRLSRLVAIKVLIFMDSGEEVIQRFVREARVIAHLDDHPSIVKILDVGREKDTRFIVMEYIDGPNLQSLINGGQIRIQWGIVIARQVAEALEYAHRGGIIHRDVKPSNILIGPDGKSAILTDFGVARLLTDTKTITWAGTPTYMSPEQESGMIGPATDVYSLGVTLYQLFTNQLPFKATRDNARKRPVPPNQIRSEIPQALSDAILSMLEVRPDDRISISEFIEIIDSFKAKIEVSGGETVEQLAIEGLTKKRRTSRIDSNTITRLGFQDPPAGFFDTATFPRTKFFEDDSVRYVKIQETLDFYRKHLSEEYKSLLKQAYTTYWLWLICVVLGFLTLISGVGMMIAGRVAEGAVTSALTVIVYFIQRVFQQREDHYRSQAKTKNSHLEYGNQWLLVIQSIDSIDNPIERARRQARLIDVLTDKLTSEKPYID